jgi:hypothetical protein
VECFTIALPVCHHGVVLYVGTASPSSSFFIQPVDGDITDIIYTSSREEVKN